MSEYYKWQQVEENTSDMRGKLSFNHQIHCKVHSAISDY